MTPNTPNAESAGRLRPVSPAPPPATRVDCSDWGPDLPAEQWSHGRFTAVTEARPVTRVDCSGWGAAPVPVLRITLEVDPAADHVTLGYALFDLLEAASRYERTLGGAGLRKVDGRAEPGRVLLTLAATEPDGAGERTRKLCDALNRATDDNPEIAVRPAFTRVLAIAG